MKALLENEVVSLYTQDKTVSEFEALIEQIKDADATLKNKIETTIVEAGMKFVPELIDYIQYNKGAARGICAMSLIRIGKSCAGMIKEAARLNKDFAWAATCILREI